MTHTAMASSEPQVSPTSVLIVDDNRDAARMLEVLLKIGGYDVSTAHDGIEALGIAKAISPTVILMDLTLPGKSGVEVAEELRQSQDFANTMIIAVSGHAADRLQQPSPFDAYLTKPVDHERLMRVLASHALSHQANVKRSQGS
jgi:CheY-like chemotaxis protein